MRGLNKAKAALQGRSCHTAKLINLFKNTIAISQVNNVATKPIQFFEKKRYIQKATTITTTRTVCHVLSIFQTPIRDEYQPFGSIPSRFRRCRHASFTHELKFPSPATTLISFKRSSSKRMFFFVLPERSKDGLLFLSCIGTYHCIRIDCNGTYRKGFTQPLNTAKPSSALTLAGPLTKPLDEVTIMACIKHTQNHPKFTWRFLTVSRSGARPIKIYINASTEEEARHNLPECILYFSARLPLHSFEIIKGSDLKSKNLGGDHA